jgi:hypothetical protein
MSRSTASGARPVAAARKPVPEVGALIEARVLGAWVPCRVLAIRQRDRRNPEVHLDLPTNIDELVELTPRMKIYVKANRADWWTWVNDHCIRPVPA